VPQRENQKRKNRNLQRFRGLDKIQKGEGKHKPGVVSTLGENRVGKTKVWWRATENQRTYLTDVGKKIEYWGKKRQVESDDRGRATCGDS